MKKAVFATAVLGLSASTALAAPPPTSPLQLRGSDTLYELTNHVLDAAGIPSTVIDYFGGGSSLGAGEMAAGNQQIAPMSRFLKNNASECDAEGPDLGQGCKVALDGIALFSDDTEANSCSTIRYTGFMEVLDQNGVAGLDDGNGGACPGCVDGPDGDGILDHYEFTDWRDVLRIIYGGQHAHISFDACTDSTPSASSLSAKACNSDVRHTLVNNWSQIFQEGSGCLGADPDACTALQHAFRRDDVSGTTDTFVSLLGMPGVLTGSKPSIASQRTFCNGLELEDNDPVRRVCAGAGDSNGEQACQAVQNSLRGPQTSTGWSGGATVNPADRNHADLGVVLAMVIPPVDAFPDNRFCSTATFGGGAFGFVPMPFASGGAARCPDGNGRVGGQCRWPGIRNAAGTIEYGCVNRKANVHGTATITNMDGRVYNLIARNPDGTMKTVPRVNPNTEVETLVNVTGAYYRLHQTRVMANATGTGCQEPDATVQIGCLVHASPCSIGYAGLGGDLADPNKALALRTPALTGGAVLPTIANVRRLNDPTGAGCDAAGDFDIRYPLARALWLNTLKSFGPNFSNITNIVDSNDADLVPDLVTQEQDVARAMCDRHYADDAALATGFITIDDTVCATPGLGGACDTPIHSCP